MISLFWSIPDVCVLEHPVCCLLLRVQIAVDITSLISSHFQGKILNVSFTPLERVHVATIAITSNLISKIVVCLCLLYNARLKSPDLQNASNLGWNMLKIGNGSSMSQRELRLDFTYHETGVFTSQHTSSTSCLCLSIWGRFITVYF